MLRHPRRAQPVEHGAAADDAVGGHARFARADVAAGEHGIAAAVHGQHGQGRRRFGRVEPDPASREVVHEEQRQLTLRGGHDRHLVLEP
jgi:hypothetical protein